MKTFLATLFFRKVYHLDFQHQIIKLKIRQTVTKKRLKPNLGWT